MKGVEIINVIELFIGFSFKFIKLLHLLMKSIKKHV